MNIIDAIQGSPEWKQARIGKVSASRMSDLTAKTKSGWGASRANYMAELIAERLTGQSADRFTNAAMAWGTEQEPAARELYGFIKGVEVKQVGCVLHPTIEGALASPDGLVGDDGLVEIKAPQTSTHIETLLGAEIDGKYYKQMQWQMACTGRKWCDYVSYDPRLGPEMQIFIQRVPRSDTDIMALEIATRAFLKEMEDTISELIAKYRSEEAA